MRTAALVILLAVILTSAGASAQTADSTKQMAVLNVGGQGQVSVSPDRATIRFGVAEVAQSAALAQQSVNRIMNGIMREMEQLGIEARQIQTQRVQLYPIQEMGERNRKPRITGYRAANSVRVTLDNIDRVGDVLDAATKVGGNEIQGIDFSLRDDSDARAQALRLAVSEAQKKASVMARALRVQLLGVLEVTESGGRGLPVQVRAARMQTAALESIPVAAGQITVTASVSIRYQIGQ